MGKASCPQVYQLGSLQKIFLVTKNIKEASLHSSSLWFLQLFSNTVLPTQNESARACLIQNILTVNVKSSLFGHEKL